MRRRLLCAVLVSITALVACDSRKSYSPRVNEPSTNGSSRIEYRDPDHGYVVRYPYSWDRAETMLSPHVEDPREILSVATFRLAARPSRCAYSGALDAIGPDDAFISISESAGDLTSTYLLRRPSAFELHQGYNAEHDECLPGQVVFDDRMIPFHDGNRSFYAYVALGTSALEDTRREVLSVLNSLEFDP